MDLRFTKRFQRRVYIFLGVLLLSLGLGTTVGVCALWPSWLEAGYAPEQPIPFSHKMHAGDLRMPCLYCHGDAVRGPTATIPSMVACMGCHAEVQPKDASGELRPGIAVLLRYRDAGEPVQWNKVHDLADFVYFDHSRHLAADLACQECHGPVETMERMRRAFGQKMSWCLGCHKQAPPSGSAAASEGASTRAPIHCSTCHR